MIDGLRRTPRVAEASADGVAGAWAILDACVERYGIETLMRRAAPLIAALREHIDRQKDAEWARTLADLDHPTPADQEAVALLAHRLISGMFHHLATRLKAAARQPAAAAHLAAFAFLFDGGDTS